MSGLEFSILFPDGRAEQLIVESETVLIGSGAHCEIKLPPEHAAVEHVLITFQGGAVYAQARTYSPPPAINGAAFSQTPILPDSVLTVGHVQLKVRPASAIEGANVVRKNQKKTSPVTLILTAILLPPAAYMLLADDGGYSPGEIPAPPALWGASQTTCPQSARDLALNNAREKKLIAEGKRERCPFFAQECVQSVPAFEVSAACFRTAGDDDMAKEMTTSGVQLKARIEEDYRGNQMRLVHSINVGDLGSAQKTVKTLLAMLEGQTGPYITWLSNNDRRLSLEIAKAKAAK